MDLFDGLMDGYKNQYGYQKLIVSLTVMHWNNGVFRRFKSTIFTFGKLVTIRELKLINPGFLDTFCPF